MDCPLQGIIFRLGYLEILFSFCVELFKILFFQPFVLLTQRTVNCRGQVWRPFSPQKKVWPKLCFIHLELHPGKRLRRLPINCNWQEMELNGIYGIWIRYLERFAASCCRQDNSTGRWKLWQVSENLVITVISSSFKWPWRGGFLRWWEERSLA
jgi:hypothetical protein